MGRVEISSELNGQLENLLETSVKELKGFNKKTYHEKIETLYSTYSTALFEIERIYHMEDDDVNVLIQVAEVFPTKAMITIEHLS